MKFDYKPWDLPHGDTDVIWRLNMSVEEAISGVGHTGSSVDLVGLEGGGLALGVVSSSDIVSGLSSSEGSLGLLELSISSCVGSGCLFGKEDGLLVGVNGKFPGMFSIVAEIPESFVLRSLSVLGTSGELILSSVAISFGQLSGRQGTVGDHESCVFGLSVFLHVPELHLRLLGIGMSLLFVGVGCSELCDASVMRFLGSEPSLDGIVSDDPSGFGLASVANLLLLVHGPEMRGVKGCVEVGDISSALGVVRHNFYTSINGRINRRLLDTAARAMGIKLATRWIHSTDISLRHGELEMVNDGLGVVKVNVTNSLASSGVLVDFVDQAKERFLGLFDGVDAIVVFVSIGNKLCDVLLDFLVGPFVDEGDGVDDPVELSLVKFLVVIGVEVIEDYHELVVAGDHEARNLLHSGNV